MRFQAIIKKVYFPNLILIIAGLSLIISLVVICDTDEFTPDIIAKEISLPLHYSLFFGVTSYQSPLYQQQSYIDISTPIILYLERQEKSPPQLSALSTSC